MNKVFVYKIEFSLYAQKLNYKPLEIVKIKTWKTNLIKKKLSELVWLIEFEFEFPDTKPF